MSHMAGKLPMAMNVALNTTFVILSYPLLYANGHGSSTSWRLMRRY
jgi:hypothetical protein